MNPHTLSIELVASAGQDVQAVEGASHGGPEQVRTEFLPQVYIGFVDCPSGVSVPIDDTGNGSVDLVAGNYYIDVGGRGFEFAMPDNDAYLINLI